MTDSIPVPSGTVAATHRHPLYGPCVITDDTHAVAIILTANGSAVVPRDSLRRLDNVR